MVLVNDTPAPTAITTGAPLLSTEVNTSQASMATSSSSPSRLISVLENSDLYNIKHPLQYGWSLWLKKPGSDREAKAGQTEGLSSMEIWKRQVEHIGDVKTVEDFWCVLNNIPGVMQLQSQSDYFFFREGIVPMWEDEANRGGGQFQVTQASGPSGGRSSSAAGPAKLDWDALWVNATMAAVGCMIGHHALINGINFGRRSRGDRIQVWMRPTTDEQRAAIEKDLKAALAAGMPPQAEASWTVKFSPFSSGGGDHGHGGAGRRDGPPRRDSRHH